LKARNDGSSDTERMDPEGTDWFIAFLFAILVAGVILALVL
jgi:hypothetical protein